MEEKTNRLLEAMNNIADSSILSTDKTVQELLSVVKTSQPKLTKWIEEHIADGDSKVGMSQIED